MNAPVNTTQNRELSLLAKAARDFSRKELAPNREKHDSFPYAPFFKDVVQKAFELDFFHTLVPENLGGMGQDMTCLCTMLDHICQEDSSLGAIILTNCAACDLLLSARPDRQFDKQVKGLVDQANHLHQFLLAYPIFVDPAQIQVLPEARLENKAYTITGHLEYLVLGSIAGQAVIPARIQGMDIYSFFLIDLNRKNVDVSDPILSLGLKACPAVDIQIKNTSARLIGEKGQGPVYFQQISDKFSIAGAAMAVGIMQGALKEALDYTRGRKQGGRKICDWSQVKMMLAQMAIDLKSSQLTIKAMCQALTDNEPDWQMSARAGSIKIHEMACDVTGNGIQVMGGVGYMKDFGQEKRYRDARQLKALFGMLPLKKIDYIQRLY